MLDLFFSVDVLLMWLTIRDEENAILLFIGYYYLDRLGSSGAVSTSTFTIDTKLVFQQFRK